MLKKNFTVTVIWDDEVQVWVATSKEIPGLVAETSTTAGMREKLICRVPELLKLNEHLVDTPLERLSVTANYQPFEQQLQFA